METFFKLLILEFKKGPPEAVRYIFSILELDILLFNTQGEKAFRIDYRSPNQIQRSCSQFSLNSEPSQDYVLINELKLI